MENNSQNATKQKNKTKTKKIEKNKIKIVKLKHHMNSLKNFWATLSTNIFEVIYQVSVNGGLFFLDLI
jgi:hypothetical protein